MIRYRLTHPGLLHSLAASGHGSQLLIADGNYPHNTGGNPHAYRIHLNLRPGLLKVDEILEVLIDAVPIESATVMVPPSGELPAAAMGYGEYLGDSVTMIPLSRFDFYEAARHSNVATIVASGDTRQYANLLLTIGVRQDLEA